ncbi:oxidoreductase [Rhodococcus opacus B4]|uniref:Oxidoreductase n=1 Tax=Rhodococcus opacus (strain B4) TaxID=632772 RepID=C1B7H8_RHOOB|nr:oxidoreductase [Rhodococcus opacus B4]
MWIPATDLTNARATSAAGTGANPGKKSPYTSSASVTTLGLTALIRMPRGSSAAAARTNRGVRDARRGRRRQSRPDRLLANNAGINRHGDLLSLSEDDWSATFAVNVDALFHLCRAVLPTMIEAGRGAIVNTASQWGLYPAPGHVAYNVSKAAVVSFTQNLARDYAPRGIRVNAVCPGEIRTPMLEAGLARKGLTVADLDEKVPFGRIGRPEEVAALVAFLASDEAPFLCGAAVEITGFRARTGLTAVR